MTRALVLGGGGPVGIAWESGLVVGLAEHGVDLRAADRVIGTSAGSVVGAQLALGFDLSVPAVRAGAEESGAMAALDGSMAARIAGLMEVVMSALTTTTTPEEARAVIGRFALEQETMPEETFVAWFATLGGAGWPAAFTCTAVHALTGESVTWDAGSAVGLPQAVASSCSVPGIFPPVTIGGERYVDGGMRSPLNADLAGGADVVVAVSVLPTSLPGTVTPGELDAVRAAGSVLELVEGDAAFVELAGAGMHLMDASRGPAAYDLGLALAATVADRVGTAWNR
jgi:NTE family protein